MCRDTAPGLVQAFEKFKNRGVAFVSLTNDSRAHVEQLVRHSSIPWPCGYGTAMEAIARFGVYNTDRISSKRNPRYDVYPTLYLIGPDGRVLWNDDQARPRHLKDPESLVRALVAEIERDLAKSG